MVYKTSTEGKGLCFSIRESDIIQRISEINTNIQGIIERMDRIMELKKDFSRGQTAEARRTTIL